MMTGDQMQYDDQQTMAAYLLPSERIIWSGRPPTGILFRKSDVFLVPFSLLWGGFTLFWEYNVFNSGAPTFFLLFGGVFVIAGLFFIFGRFIFDMWIRQNTVYALTNERVLILAGLFSQTLRALNLKSLPVISLEISSDGRGTIMFGTPVGFGFVINNPSWPGVGRMSPPMFEKIENASEVYKLVQSTANQ